MKKILKVVLLSLAVIGGGMSVTSCDEETITQILSLLVGGQASTYSGTATLECLEGTYEPMNYASLAKGTATLQATVSPSSLNGTATLTIQGVTLGDVTIGEVNLYNLAYTANSDNTQCTMDLGESSSITGTFTYNGQSHEGSSAYIGKAIATASTLTLEMTLYFGDEMTEAVNLTYSGKVVETAQ